MYSVPKSLKDLPALFTLHWTQKTLLVDNLTPDNHDEAFALVQDSAARGDNIGFDEFPHSEDFQEILVCSAAFSLGDVTSGVLLGLIIVHPSNCSRSQGPYFADLYFITASEISQKPYWRDLARLSRDLVPRLKLRYGAVLSSVFCPCVDRLQALTEEGFVVTACVNDAGTLAGSKNLTSSYILNSDLHLRSLPKYPLSMVCDSVVPTDLSFNASPVSSIPFLPIDHIMSDGTEIIIRCSRTDESADFNRMFDGGFGLDEWPVGSFCGRTVNSTFYNIVVESKLTGTNMAAIIFGISSYSRGNSAGMIDGYGTIHPDYIGCGIAREVSEMMQELAAALGYRAINTDTTVDNLAAMATLLGDGFVMTGVIPKSVYVVDRGWTDVALFYKPLSGAASRNVLKLKKTKGQIKSKL